MKRLVSLLALLALAPAANAAEQGLARPDFLPADTQIMTALEASPSVAEARAMLETAIQALPATLRPVFLLRDIEGLSGEETAEALGLNAGVVKVRLHRARLALRERLSAYFGERLAQTGA